MKNNVLAGLAIVVMAGFAASGSIAQSASTRSYVSTQNAQDTVPNYPVSGQTRIVPRHVYDVRAVSQTYVPKGYRPAWEDGRLNPYRGVQTVDGYYETQELYTNRLPRRLIVQETRKHTTKDPVVVGRVVLPASQCIRVNWNGVCLDGYAANPGRVPKGYPQPYK